ncbi:MAG: CRISPR-associated ring nuclease [Blastocatellia bacterium]|nr:CRISPR-associated ring nuclease [Blastocatellia bacterium]
MKKILLATLGEAPAVVTEAIDKLQADGVRVDYVVVPTTQDTYALSSLILLGEHLPNYYNNQVTLLDARTLGTFHDVDSDTAAVEFMNQTCAALRDYRKKGWEVYACIAGGRKAMSALLTLAVQFYGAQRLFHVLVEDPKLEEEGHICRLKNKSVEEQNRALHPPVERIKLVNLPFVGLFPLLGSLIAGLQGRSVSPEVKELLEQNNLLHGGQPTPIGQVVLQVLESVEALPDPRQGDCEIQLAKKEPREAEETEKWGDRLANRFLFVERIEDIGWREGQPKVKAEPPNFLIVYLPGRRVQGIGFRLTTTAQTRGQLERARQEIEHWIEREVR